MSAFPITRLLTQAAARLQPRTITCAADKSVGRFEAEVLLASILNKDRVWLLAHANDLIPYSAVQRFTKLVQRRAHHEPIAYILGTKDFYGRPFSVNRHTLIPRPETELLVEQALEDVHAPQTLIWDVGTGSGAVGITLALEVPTASVIATDVSSEALRVARNNAKRLHASNSTFLTADLLSARIDSLLRNAKQKTLIITANLPYLPLSDQKTLEPDVTDFEPASALFSGRDGLELIIRFLDQIALAKHAWHFSTITMLLEFDPPQAKTLQRIAKSTFPSAAVTVIKDLAKRNRILRIRLP